MHGVNTVQLSAVVHVVFEKFWGVNLMIDGRGAGVGVQCFRDIRRVLTRRNYVPGTGSDRD